MLFNSRKFIDQPTWNQILIINNYDYLFITYLPDKALHILPFLIYICFLSYRLYSRLVEIWLYLLGSSLFHIIRVRQRIYNSIHLLFQCQEMGGCLGSTAISTDPSFIHLTNYPLGASAKAVYQGHPGRDKWEQSQHAESPSSSVSDLGSLREWRCKS